MEAILTLQKDSALIRVMLENGEDKVFFTSTEFGFICSQICFPLLLNFYTGDDIANDNLIKLAKDMSYLDCGRLHEVLKMIYISKVDYSSLNDLLQREIIRYTGYKKVVCGDNISVALKNDGSLVMWTDSFLSQANCHKNTHYIPWGYDFVSIRIVDQVCMAIRENGTFELWNYYILKNEHIIMYNSIEYICKISNSALNIYLSKEGYCLFEITEQFHVFNMFDCVHFQCDSKIYGFIFIDKKGLYFLAIINKESQLIHIEGQFIKAVKCLYIFALKSNDDLICINSEQINEEIFIDSDVVDVQNTIRFMVALKIDGSLIFRLKGPLQVPNYKFIAIACQDVTFSMLKDDGFILQMGDSDNQTNENDYISIVSGFNHTVGIKKDGTLQTWGHEAMIKFTPL